MAKPRTERTLLFPSKEFREEVRKASKARGFPLRSNKRLRPPPLTARTTVRNGLAMKEIYLFLFEQQNRSKQGKATLFPARYCQRSISSFFLCARKRGFISKEDLFVGSFFRLRAAHKHQRDRKESSSGKY